MAAKKKFPYRAALVACRGTCVGGQGEESCRYGCTGCGVCVHTCKFHAIVIGSQGVAEVKEEACIACGQCVRACPQGIIHIHECANSMVVKCSNRDRGADARKECENSCIGCGICEKTCTANAIHVMENCAVIQEMYCLSCGMCLVKCPRHVIWDLRGIYVR